MAEDNRSDMELKDVSSLMRIEKGSGQLSEVRKDLYPAMLALQKRIARECEINSDVGSLEYDLLVEKKKKLHVNIKLLVELRMSKVAAMALRGAMGTINAVDNLPPEERQFYDEVLEAAKTLWSAPHRQKTVRVPELGPETPTAPAPVPEAEPVEEIQAEEIPVIPDEGPTEMEPPADMPDSIPEEPVQTPQVIEIPPIPEEELMGEEPAEAPVQTPEPEAKAEEEEDENPYADCFDMVTVRMIETVEPFAGSERNYALKKEEVVRLPKSLATILVGRKLAVELKI